MSRQRLREGSIKWETQLSLSSFSQKILKMTKHLAFNEKVKIIEIYIPEKVKIFIENNLIEELKYFQKKYSFEVKLFSEKKFIVPEYKIDLLNKSKKIINSVENVNNIIDPKNTKTIIKDVKNVGVKNNLSKKSKIKLKKVKSKKKIKTLWVRRKKLN